MLDEECPICFEATPLPLVALQPCGHRFCLSCIDEAFKRRVSCPLCRQIPFGKADSAHEQQDDVVVISFPPWSYAGVTLTNSTLGVRITKLDAADVLSRAGLCVDDELLELNGIPCRRHQTVVAMWDRIAEESRRTTDVILVNVKVRRPRPRLLWTRFASAPREWREPRIHIFERLF